MSTLRHQHNAVVQFGEDTAHEALIHTVHHAASMCHTCVVCDSYPGIKLHPQTQTQITPRTPPPENILDLPLHSLLCMCDYVILIY